MRFLYPSTWELLGYNRFVQMATAAGYDARKNFAYFIVYQKSLFYRVSVRRVCSKSFSFGLC